MTEIIVEPFHAMFMRTVIGMFLYIVSQVVFHGGYLIYLMDCSLKTQQDAITFTLFQNEAEKEKEKTLKEDGDKSETEAIECEITTESNETELAQDSEKSAQWWDKIIGEFQKNFSKNNFTCVWIGLAFILKSVFQAFKLFYRHVPTRSSRYL